MNIRKSAEDYLEMILMITEEKGFVRSIDIANGLNVTKPSVSIAMKQFRENGYILMDDDNKITLTETGLRIARRTLDRHNALSSFLIRLGVPADKAREDACKIEHDISSETFDAILRFNSEHDI